MMSWKDGHDNQWGAVGTMLCAIPQGRDVYLAVWDSATAWWSFCSVEAGQAILTRCEGRAVQG